jgi:hypothetical protein
MRTHRSQLLFRDHQAGFRCAQIACRCERNTSGNDLANGENEPSDIRRGSLAQPPNE